MAANVGKQNISNARILNNKQCSDFRSSNVFFLCASPTKPGIWKWSQSIWLTLCFFLLTQFSSAFASWLSLVFETWNTCKCPCHIFKPAGSKLWCLCCAIVYVVCVLNMLSNGKQTPSLVKVFFPLETLNL